MLICHVFYKDILSYCPELRQKNPFSTEFPPFDIVWGYEGIGYWCLYYFYIPRRLTYKGLYK